MSVEDGTKERLSASKDSVFIGPKELGIDPETQLPVSIRKGPFGVYVQLGETVEGSKERPKQQSLLRGQIPSDIDLALGLRLLSLPRAIGAHPESGDLIFAGAGRFGPYLKVGERYFKTETNEDVLTLGLNRAVTIIAEARASSADAIDIDYEGDSNDDYEFNANHSFEEEVYSEEWKEHRPKEYFEYRQMWDEIPRDQITTDFPLHLDIETTNICNLKCPMCPRTEMINNETFGELGRMTKEQYSDIINQASKYGTKSIKLNYLGEPLAHKEVVWQVEYAKQNGIVDIMMNSNATLLTKECGRALLEAGLDNMYVSFDAVSPDLFGQQRVGTTLGKVIDNVYEFVKLRNEKFPHVQVRLSMVMYNEPEWLEQFEGIKIMWKRLVDSVGYGFYTERDRNSFGEYPEVEGFWCAQPFQRMFLKYNGNVTICCVDDQDQTIVGNWKLQPLHEIWHNEAYTEIRRLHTEDQYYQMEMCRKCYLPVS